MNIHQSISKNLLKIAMRSLQYLDEAAITICIVLSVRGSEAVYNLKDTSAI
jgi:hypothetical protein